MQAHQAIAQHFPFRGQTVIALQNQGRRKRSDISCRPVARRHPDQDDKRPYPGNQRKPAFQRKAADHNIRKRSQREIIYIKQRQQIGQQANSDSLQNQRKADHPDRTSQHLLRVDASHAHRNLRIAEIGKIDCGYHNDQQGYAQQQTYQRIVTFLLLGVETAIRLEIDIGKGGQPQVHRFPSQLLVVEVTLEVVDKTVGRRCMVEANIAFEIILRPAAFTVAVRNFPVDRISDNRIIRKILIDTADGGGPAFAGDYLARSRRRAEEFPGHALRDQYLIREVQGTAFAFYHGKFEYIRVISGNGV